ncbi:hypothetical protein [Amycolatopsis circi]|uniref:hypothetical protein n=1 Tax=Amycolatopsis circi TaxID=871959 RepID=UPI000E246075|nr:hypothetical protein [Amycolatopsis circi]
MATLRFAFHPPSLTGGPVLVQYVDDVALTDLIDRFELAEGMSPAGEAYGGLPRHCYSGTKTGHFHGLAEEEGKTLLLACSCGSEGCWPLLARITVTEDAVVWDSFGQPRRPERDYRRFGPFRFARAQYDAAVRELDSA